MMNILTSFTHLKTGEGDRISYTYSTLDDDGNVIAQNKRGNFVALDADLKAHLVAVNTYIAEHKLTPTTEG